MKPLKKESNPDNKRFSKRTNPILPITGIILVGGKSLRMGQPKAFMKFGENTLLELTIRTLQSITKSIMIVTNENLKIPDSISSHNIIKDLFHEIGPLGGLHAGLSAAGTDWSFVTACDTPFLENKLIRYLYTLTKNDIQIVIPKTNQGYHPLQAFYHKSIIPHLEEKIRNHDYALHHLLKDIPIREVDETEILNHDISELNFININTPHDYQMALEIFQKQLSDLDET